MSRMFVNSLEFVVIVNQNVIWQYNNIIPHNILSAIYFNTCKVYFCNLISAGTGSSFL